MATFTCGEIIRQAAVSVQDTGAVRWTYPEMLDHLNAAVREVASRKPNAVSESRVKTLDPGTSQELESDETILIKAIRNITGENTLYVDGVTSRILKRRGGATIRTLRSVEMLDAMMPGWMDENILPFNVNVNYAAYDISNPKEFWVAPGNTGSGKIEVIVGVTPAIIATPVSPLDPASYTAVVPLDTSYFSVLLDFMLYRAMTKDASLPGAAQRAVAHKQLFDDAMAAMIANERAISLSTFAMIGSGG